MADGELKAADSMELCTAGDKLMDEATDAADADADWTILEATPGLTTVLAAIAAAMEATAVKGLAVATTLPTTEPAELMMAVLTTEPAELVTVWLWNLGGLV